MFPNDFQKQYTPPINLDYPIFLLFCGTNFPFGFLKSFPKHKRIPYLRVFRGEKEMQNCRFQDLPKSLQDAYEMIYSENVKRVSSLDSDITVESSLSIWRELILQENTLVFYKLESDKPVLFALVVDYRKTKAVTGMNLVRISSVSIAKTDPIERLGELKGLLEHLVSFFGPNTQPNVFGLITSCEVEHYRKMLQVVDPVTGKETKFLSRLPPFVERLQDLSRLPYYHKLVCTFSGDLDIVREYL